MSFALSQRRAHRHPVGLVIVVGLHAVLAAALLSARLQPAAPEPPPVVLTPMDPVRVTPPPPAVLPPPNRAKLPTPIITTPAVPDPVSDPVIQAKVDDTPVAPPPTVLAGPDENRILNNVRVEPRPARIDAGAARCRPEYPAAAQRAGVSGTTRVRFTVDALGRIAGSQVVRASGPTREHRLMDQAAAAALAQCPVQVGTDEQGRPVGTTIDVDYVWALN